MSRHYLRVLPLLLLMLTLALGTLHASEQSLEAHFIDVGQGAGTSISFYYHQRKTGQSRFGTYIKFTKAQLFVIERCTDSKRGSNW